MKLRLIDLAHVASTDIDPNKGFDAKEVDRLVNSVVLKANESLGYATHFTEFQRAHVAEIYHSLGFTHQTIRTILRAGHSSPTSVDALPMTRLQLEALYAICLMIEDSRYVGVYLKDSWSKEYRRFLLQEIECAKLPRFSTFLGNHARPLLKQLQAYAGVTKDEVATIEHEELGKPIPPGRNIVKIEYFPTPGRIISKLRTGPRKQLLMRLYPEYQLLSAYVHGSSTKPRMFKSLFNPRSKYRDLFQTKDLEQMFQKDVGEECIWLSYLSIVQSCTELVEVCGADVELRATLVKAWQPLTDGSLLGRTVWEMRSKALLGAVG